MKKRTQSPQKKRIFIHLGVSLLLFVSFLGVLLTSVWLTNQPSSTISRADEPVGVRYRDEIFSEVRLEPNKEYSAINNKKLLLDIYQPKIDSEEKRAAIIWVHGGGFVSGDKEAMSVYGKRFAKRGFVSLSINYQLGNEDIGENTGVSANSLLTFPTVLQAQHDAQTAVRWLKAHANEYRVDPDKIFIGGKSAGGVISLLVGYNYEVAPKREYSEFSPKVAGVISMVGVSDSRTVLTGDPPLIMFNGEEDVIIRFSDVKKFQNAVKESNLVYEFYNYPNTGHNLAGHTEDTFTKTAQFLQKIIVKDPEDPSVTQIPDPTVEVTREVTLVPSPTSVITDEESKNKVLVYFRNNREVVCSFMKKYFDEKNMKPEELTETQLQNFASKNPIIAKVVNLTQAKAESVISAYNQVCLKK